MQPLDTQTIKHRKLKIYRNYLMFLDSSIQLCNLFSPCFCFEVFLFHFYFFKLCFLFALSYAFHYYKHLLQLIIKNLKLTNTMKRKRKGNILFTVRKKKDNGKLFHVDTHPHTHTHKEGVHE